MLTPKKTFLKTGKEQINLTPCRTLLDFWAWAYSDLLQNTTRGVFAEYIVAVLLGIDDIPHMPWDAYDLKLKNGATIEIKTMSQLQGWAQKALSIPRVVLSPTRSWDPTTGVMKIEPSFNADIYIFCYHTADTHDTADSLDIEQWQFFIMTKDRLIELLSGRKSISLKDLLKKGVEPVISSQVSETVNRLSLHKSE